jgi:MoxR-like ATPase
MNSPVVQCFDAASDALNKCLLERREEVKCVLVGLVSGKSVNVVGMYGTAKSDLCRGLARCIGGANYFEYCFYKETAVDEIFGPPDIEHYSKMERLIDGYAPAAHIVFWDEFWNASGATQNALHSLRNERRIRNGSKMIDCPMLFEMGASNLWPVGDGFENSGAAFDRFAIRKEVRRCSPISWEQLCFGDLPSVNDIQPCMTIDNVKQAQSESRALDFSEDAADALISIFNAIQEEGVQISERRRVWSCHIAKAAAWLEGKAEVEPEHLDVLKHVLWNHPVEQPIKVAKIIGEIANPIGMQVNDLIHEMEETLSKSCFQGRLNMADPEFKAGLQKAASAFKKLDGMKNSGNKDAKAAVDIYRNRLRTINTMGLRGN